MQKRDKRMSLQLSGTESSWMMQPQWLLVTPWSKPHNFRPIFNHLALTAVSKHWWTEGSESYCTHQHRNRGTRKLGAFKGFDNTRTGHNFGKAIRQTGDEMCNRSQEL